MVVKSIVGGIINRVPLSGYVVPTTVSNYLNEQTTSGSESESDSEASDIQELPPSPRDVIHTQLLRNRTKKLSSDLTLYDSEIEETSPDSLGDPIDIRVKQFLNDQNDEFNRLINSNLDVVMKQQKYPEIVSENFDSNNGNGHANYGNNSNKSVIKKNSFLNDNQINHRFTEADFENINSTFNTALNPPPEEKSFFTSLVSGAATKVFSKVVKSYYPDTKVNNGVIPIDQLLDNDVKMDIFIDSLNNDIKIKLLEELSQDLQKRDFIDSTFGNVNNSANSKPVPPENQLFLDKVQDFLIISIKFIIVCLKLSIPLWKFFYMKFMNNELVLINEKNVTKVFNFIMKLMKIMDNKLNKNDQLINNYYHNSNQILLNEPDLHELYEELSTETQNFVSTQFENVNPIATNTWKRTAVDFLLDRYLRQGQTPPQTPVTKYSDLAKFDLAKYEQNQRFYRSQEDVGIIKAAELFANGL